MGSQSARWNFDMVARSGAAARILAQGGASGRRISKSLAVNALHECSCAMIGRSFSRCQHRVRRGS
jgi:hypothetical protein